MKIIYDISFLGSAHYSNKCRTGLARVVENLLDILVANEECEICFSAFNSFDQLIQSVHYLAAHPHLRNHSFWNSGSLIMNQVDRIDERAFTDPNTLTSAWWRRKISSILIKRAAMLYHAKDKTMLDQMDIFHSTFYPLPSQVRSSPKLQKFITICDMIPFLYPQYFETPIIDNFNNIISSIRPDDWVIAISQSTKNDFCNHLKFDPSRVFVTPLAASPMFYKCTDIDRVAKMRKEYQIPDDPYILSLCTLEPRKNIDHTIRCFIKTIRQQHISDLNLVLVGIKGWDYDRIISEISGVTELRERIIVTGYVPDEDLAALYSGAAMFVYPSIYEGFGLPPLEAMQCGVPVITSNTSSLPEVVGNAGIMVVPDDEDALCQAFWAIYGDNTLRKHLSTLSLERARLFSWEKCGRDTIEAYRSALER